MSKKKPATNTHDRCKAHLQAWLNDRIGKTLRIDETLFSLVRYYGFSLKVARQTLTEILSVNTGTIAVYPISVGLIVSLNLNGAPGANRCFEWGGIRLNATSGFITEFIVTKELA